ncbi:MAG: RecX family transcriptional regulator [Crocinitomicaceae bacterium]|nr:RecX family transcriptional regulator [Crocinitomicaceae bacterium]
MSDSPSYTLIEAKPKIESYCAYQERCDFEVRQKLYSWNLSAEDVNALIAHLITQNYLNEERFAQAYVSGKFRIKKWGRIKILRELKLRKISNYSIQKAFEQIEDEEYLQTMRQLLESKSKTTKGKNQWDKQNKLKRYLASKGYETELIFELFKSED